MRGPIEFVNDLIDRDYQYYRNYLSRRLLFNDTFKYRKSFEPVPKENALAVFDKADHEEIGERVAQSTKLGFNVGIVLAGLKYLQVSGLKAENFRKSVPVTVGTLLFCTGVGFSYGSLVGLISQLRGNEDGVTNHVLAGFLAFAPSGAFAKKNKILNGVNAGLAAGAILGLIKGLQDPAYYTKGKQAQAVYTKQAIRVNF